MLVSSEMIRFYLQNVFDIVKFIASNYVIKEHSSQNTSEIYLTVILRTRVVYELIADEVRSTETAIAHIRREWVE